MIIRNESDFPFPKDTKVVKLLKKRKYEVVWNLRILRKKKIYAFVLENYLQMIYPSFLCMIRNIGQNNGYFM